MIFNSLTPTQPGATVAIKHIGYVTHDVLRIVTEKPMGFAYHPGQAVNLSINEEDWRDKRNPFTMTSLPGDDDLEFMIKVYPAHQGVTNRLSALKPTDTLILHDVYGAIAYRGEGVFVAGGAGVTPFVAILRDLHVRDGILIFANKTQADIIIEDELREMLGANLVNILSEKDADGYHSGQVDAPFLQAHSGSGNKPYYLCGPPPMIEAVESALAAMKVAASAIVKEIF